jgi:hypothetical protein
MLMIVHSASYTLPVSAGLDGHHVFLQGDLPPALLAFVYPAQRCLESVK